MSDAPTPAPAARPPRRRRFRLGPVWLELALFALVCGLAALVLLAASPAGTRFLFAAVESLSGGAVRVGRVEGSVLDALSIQGLEVDTAKARVRLDRVELAWRPAQLLYGRLQIDRLALGKLALKLAPSHEPSKVPESLASPLSIQLGRASLAELVIDGRSVLADAVLTADSDGEHHRLRLAQATTPWFQGEGELRLAGTRPFKLGGALALRGEAEQRPWHVDVALAGSLESLRLSGRGASTLRPASPLASVAPAAGFVRVAVPAKAAAAGAKTAPARPSPPAKAPATAAPAKPAEPFSVDFDLYLSPFAATPWNILQRGQLNTRAFNLGALAPGLPRSALDLALRAEPRGETVAASLSLRNALAGDWPDGRLPLATLEAQWLIDAQVARIERFEARLTGGRVLLSGQAAREQLALAAELDKLDPRIFGGPAWPVSGRLQLSGAPAAPVLAGQLGDKRLAASFEAALAGAGEARALEIRKLKLDSGQGKLELGGRLALAGTRGYTLNGKLAGFDPAALSDLAGHKIAAGSINAALTLQGQLAAPLGAGLKAEIQPSRFNGQPLQGTLRGDWRGNRADDVALALSLGANRLNARGAFGRPGDQLALDVALPDVGDFGPGFNGRVDARLTLAGTLKRPTLDGTAQVAALRMPGDIRLGEASLAARLEAAPDKPASSPLVLRLEVAGLTAPKTEVPRLKLAVNGTQAAHRIEASGAGHAAGQDFDLVLAAEGALDGGGWRGRIERLSNGGTWPLQLNAPARLALSPGGGAVEALDAQLLGARIDIRRAQWQGGRFAAQGEIRNLALAEWLTRLPVQNKRIVTDLVLATRFDLSGDERLAGSLVVERQSGDLSLSVDDPTVKPMPLRLSSARVQLELAGDRASVAADLKSDAFGSAAGQLATRFERTEAGWRPAAGAPLEGRLRADMPALGWVGPLLGPTAKVEGKLAAELTAGGVIGAPRWFGKLNADGVAIRLPDSGVNYQEGRLEATLEGDTAQLAAFSLKGGRGEVTASGRMSLRDAGPEGALLVKFNRFGALTRPDRNLVVSGETNLGVQGEALTLTGKLTADEGLVELPRSDAPRLGDDVVVKGRGEAVRKQAKPILLTLRLDLDLGQKFVFKGQGLDARLSGLVRLSASPTQNLGASGSVKVEEGRYAAYGQNLAIDRGIVTFQGPLDNPALDILAVRKNLPVEVGVKIVGTALAPRVSLTSDEPMPDSEKLSWLVLGRGTAGSGGDADLLLAAADALFTAGESVSLRQQMAATFGLDDISVGRSDAYTRKDDTGGNNNPMAGRVVSLGKRLSDRAYVSYEQSLEGVGYAVKLTYQLSKRVSVALTAGETSSVDVLYSWMFD